MTTTDPRRRSAINNFFQYLLFSMAPIFLDIIVACVFLAVNFDISLALMLLVVMVACESSVRARLVRRSSSVLQTCGQA